MSIRITDISISDTEVTVGQQFSITVWADETTWENLSNDFVNWNEVRFSFSNWNKVLNYLYTKPELTVDAHAIYDADGKALFDLNFQQVSYSGGGTSQYSAETINWFVREVLNE